MNWFKSFLNKLRGSPSGEVELIDESMTNFTPRLREVLRVAHKEADRFGHQVIRAEHLLLGLIKLGQGVAFNVLLQSGLNLARVRQELEKQIGHGPSQSPPAFVPFAPEVKEILELAQQEARALHHTYIGTEHLLLGMLREGKSVAARVLELFTVSIEQMREDIIKELTPDTPPPKDERKVKQ